MPKKTISIPFNRVSIASAPALTGTAMAMHTLRDLFPDGYITNPFRIPDDCDVSRPIDLLAAMRPVVGGLGVPGHRPDGQGRVVHGQQHIWQRME